MNGNRCPACCGIRPLGTEGFIERARTLYGDQFDYDKVSYVNGETEVIVTCRRHGDFTIKPTWMLNHGKICPDCKQEIRARQKLEAAAAPHFTPDPTVLTRFSQKKT
jgi:hypothetical protein